MTNDLPRILLVDDERPVRDLLGRVLEMEGYLVYLAADGEEAIEIAKDRDGRIDLVLLDLHLGGGLTGPETYRELKVLCPNLPVLVISGDPHDPLLGTMPAEPILLKPFAPERLTASVQSMLGAPPGPSDPSTVLSAP